MLLAKLWDKQESINGVSAGYILAARGELEKEPNVILIYDDQTNIVSNIELESQIRTNLQIASDADIQTVMSTYLKQLEDAKAKAEEEAKLNGDKIVSLETQLSTITEELNKTKIELANTKNDTIMNSNLSKISLTALMELDERITALEPATTDESTTTDSSNTTTTTTV